MPEKAAKLRAITIRWRIAHPDKYKAQATLGNAVRDGKKIKPSLCEPCGKEGRIHGHHADYAKPLDVQWLCAMCHHRHHAEERKNG
jgi:hypothetical protein